MNQCEMMFEIEMTPNRFREIAAELETLAKSDLFIKGQVIRYKLNHKFSFVYRPDAKITPKVFDVKESSQHPLDILNLDISIPEAKKALNTPPRI
jgi:hypothetical protein